MSPALPQLKAREWIVVTDFDGTLTRLDVGNELCIKAAPKEFAFLQNEYRQGRITLKDYQIKMWSKFPMGERDFRRLSRELGALRDGVNSFLETCANVGVPVYVASCGLRPYIDEVLDAFLTPAARKAITDIQCNEARFAADHISDFIPPSNAPDSPYPLDKGVWCDELRAQHSAQNPNVKVLGIGNGSSDKSFLGHVDFLAATDGLAEHAKKVGHPFFYFDDFDLLKKSLL